MSNDPDITNVQWATPSLTLDVRTSTICCLQQSRGEWRADVVVFIPDSKDLKYNYELKQVRRVCKELQVGENLVKVEYDSSTVAREYQRREYLILNASTSFEETTWT